MLLTNRRHRLLYMAIAGMEIGWIAPWALLLIDFWRQRLALSLLAETDSAATVDALANLLTMPPAAFYLLLLGLMLLYMLAADLLNQRQIGFPLRELIMLVLVVGTSLLAVRLLIYPGMGALHWGWLGNVFRALFDFTAGRRPEVVILLINIFLWFRVAVNTDRDLTFFRVALSFRVALLIAITGNALLIGLGVQPLLTALLYFSLFLMAGLTAMAIARTDEKAYAVEGSRGALLPWPRLAQIVATGTVILGVGALASLAYTPGNIRTVLGWFSPLWRLVGTMVGWLLFAVAWALTPMMEWLINTLRRLMARLGPIEDLPPPPSAGEMMNIDITPTDITDFLNRWTYVRYGLVLLIIAIVLGLVWLFFLRTPRRDLADEDEDHEAERLTLGGNLLNRGLDRLRNLMDLARRYGVGAQLLAAISVQNIYANVSRTAGERGFPRHPSQPPDVYLPVLWSAFPGCEAELARITDAYMRVEYGDRSLDDVELSALRQDYRVIQESDSPEPD